MSHTYQCVGHDNYECGLPVIRKRQLHEDEQPRCKSCAKFAKAEYQHQYYATHRGKAQEYQRQYNIQHRKTTRRNNNFRAQYSTTAKQQEREATRSSYSHSYLMHSSPEKMAKDINKILRGEAELAAVK